MIQNVAVVGGGKMGRQIALCCSIHGYHTTLYDMNEAMLEDVAKWANEYLQGRIEKKRMTQEQVGHIQERFTVVSDLEAAAENADIVIEAIFESEDAKKDLFRKLSNIVQPDCILATNSSFMVSSIFKDVISEPRRLCNIHFYNPALVMEFVEVVCGQHTDPKVGRAAFDFAVSLGKKPILQKKEIPGFAGNYLLKGLNRRAQMLQERDILSYQESDLLIEQGIGRKKGPFRLMDMTGLALSRQVMQNEFEQTGVKPPCYDLICKLVDEGRLGLQTGHGFYDYKEPYTLNTAHIPSWEGVQVRSINHLVVIGCDCGALRLAEQAKCFGVAVSVTDGSDLAALKQADLILEAMPEEEGAKRDAIQKLQPFMAPDAIVVSVTKSIPSSLLAESMAKPKNLLSLHLIEGSNLAEVVQGKHTALEAVAATYEFLKKLNRIPIWEKEELPGFGYRFLLNGFGHCARELVEQGYCTIQEVDIALKYGMGHTYGFFEMVDRIGVDVFFAELETEYRSSGQKPAMYDCFYALAADCRLGKKTGQGFYCYS